MFESSTVAAVIQSELASLRADGRDRSLGELVELVGACQSVINQVTALQTLAMAHVAAVEDVELEDGTVAEQHRGLGHQRLDAPALVSDQLGVGDAVASSRLSAAVDVVTRVPGVFEAMGAGRLDEYRARVVGEELRDSPAQVCAQVVARIAGSLGSEPPAVLRRRVRRALAAVDPDLLRARAARARSERGLRRWPGDEPGVDTWMGSFPVEASRSGWAVVDGLARQYVQDGRAAGVEQARADALMDLIHARATGTFVVQLAVPADQLTEPITTDQLATTDQLTATPRESVGESVGDTAPTTVSETVDPDDGAVRAEPDLVTEGAPAMEAVAASAAAASDADALVTVAGFGMPGTAQVRRGWLTSLGDGTDPDLDTTSDTTSARTSDTTSDPASDPASARTSDSVSDSGVTVRHEVVACDTETGALMAVATDPDITSPDKPGRRPVTESTAYRPPAALIDLVRARDGRCRFPGCTVNARFCDLDHVRPWPLGPTQAANLMCLCRRHHRIKQTVRWRVRIEPDATVTWTDPTGRVRTTLPQDFLQLRDNEPVRRASMPANIRGPKHAGPEHAGPGHPRPERAGSETVTAAPVDEPGVLWSAWEEELAHELARAERHADRRRVDPRRAEELAAPPGRTVGRAVGLSAELSAGLDDYTIDPAFAAACPGRRLRRRTSGEGDPPF